MRILDKLQPKSVFHYFEDICEIPHGSGNIEAISEYLVKFAKERNLVVIQDKLKNVIIIKEATEGYEECEPVILQGHMDMVAVQKLNSTINMETDSLQLVVEGDFIYAKDTSLGGDDGIALAYGLALLDATEIKHPRLEVIFTVDEETGMDGAKDIDLSMLQGHQLLNLDSEEEGYLLTSCAGGAKVEAILPLVYEEKQGSIYQITMEGLLGGHSGVEIHKGRGNASYLLARVLLELKEKLDFSIVDINGGLKDNAIPREAKASIVVNPEDCKVLETEMKLIEAKIKNEYQSKDGNLTVCCEKQEDSMVQAVTIKDTLRIIRFILTMPNGVQTMSGAIEGLVETSLNLGVMKIIKEGLFVRYAVRSSIQSAKEHLIDRMKITSEILGAKIVAEGNYPAWEYRQDSPLREKALQIYQEMYGKDMVVQAIHAGLECGFFANKIKNLDCVSIGPDMENIHTTEEKLSISSTKRIWEYILQILEKK